MQASSTTYAREHARLARKQQVTPDTARRRAHFMTTSIFDSRMGGLRLREHWTAEVDAILATYREFERLVPAKDRKGSSHPGEDGRYVESLVKAYLSRYLPRDLEVLSGFILRPQAITGTRGYERKDEKDAASTQLDVIVYDSAHYPVFQRFGDSAVVPPEGVVAIISVKKTLRSDDVCDELRALMLAARLCHCFADEPPIIDHDQPPDTQSIGESAYVVPRDGSRTSVGKPRTRLRGPFLGLVGICWEPTRKRHKLDAEGVLTDIRAFYKTARETTPLTFDEIIGYAGALEQWSITKRRPTRGQGGITARLHRFAHRQDTPPTDDDPGDRHLGLQFLLSGILSVYYDTTRNTRKGPGFIAFDSVRNAKPDEEVLVPYDTLRDPSAPGVAQAKSAS